MKLSETEFRALFDLGYEIGTLKEKLRRAENKLKDLRIVNDFLEFTNDSHEQEIARYERNRSRAIAILKRRGLREGVKR